MEEARTWLSEWVVKRSVTIAKLHRAVWAALMTKPTLSEGHAFLPQGSKVLRHQTSKPPSCDELNRPSSRSTQKTSVYPGFRAHRLLPLPSLFPLPLLSGAVLSSFKYRLLSFFLSYC